MQDSGFSGGSAASSPLKSVASARSNPIANPSKKFIIKSKLAPTHSTSVSFHQKINSYTSIPDIIEMKAMVLPGKQIIHYRKKELDITSNRLPKVTSLQNIPMATSSLTSSPKKPQKMAKLKPILRNFEVKMRKNQDLLDEVLMKGGDDSVDESPNKNSLDNSISLSVEESKDEDIFTPALHKLAADKADTDILNLVNHNLKDETLTGFLGNMNGLLRKINLTGNILGPLSTEKLLNFFSKSWSESRLLELDLEETEFTDQLGQALFNNMSKMKYLRVLNLTSNFLTHSCSNDLRNMLATNNSLKELYLRRNKFTGIAGANIFQGLYFNSSLKVLDLSWNLLSMKPCIEALTKVISHDSGSLIHLDLSHNNFTIRESLALKQVLETNHSLYGFHFEGNYGYLDWKGFLQISEHTRKFATGDYLNSRRIKGLKTHPVSCKFKPPLTNFEDSDDEEEDHNIRDCCWLCDNWHETVFELSLDELSDMPPVRKVFIHLDIDKFNAIPMNKPNSKGSKYVLRKVLPPSRITFFFTVNELQITSERFFTVKNPKPLIKNIKIGELLIQELEMPELNYIEPPSKT